METKLQPRLHRIDINMRKKLSSTGVRDVRSFDEQEVILETDEEILIIKGRELHVGSLNTEKGEIDISGIIDSLTYTESKNIGDRKKALTKRLFR